MLGSFLKRRRLERDLAKYVSPERVRAMAEGREPSPPSIRSGPIEFIFGIIRADTAEMLSQRVDIVVELSHAQGACIHHMVGSLIVIAFGTFPGEAPSSPELRKSLVASLRERLQTDIKILHDSAQADYGNLGRTRISWTFIFPRFDEALAAVGGMRFGQAEEFGA